MTIDGLWGGPRPQVFIDSHKDLQKAVVAKMGAFGMAPLLQVWGGGVPNTWINHYPDAKWSATSSGREDTRPPWGDGNPSRQPDLIVHFSESNNLCISDRNSSIETLFPNGTGSW